MYTVTIIRLFLPIFICLVTSMALPASRRPSIVLPVVPGKVFKSMLSYFELSAPIVIILWCIVEENVLLFYLFCLFCTTCSVYPSLFFVSEGGLIMMSCVHIIFTIISAGLTVQNALCWTSTASSVQDTAENTYRLLPCQTLLYYYLPGVNILSCNDCWAFEDLTNLQKS